MALKVIDTRLTRKAGYFSPWNDLGLVKSGLCCPATLLHSRVLKSIVADFYSASYLSDYM